jgi:hypothetical protein
MSEIIDVTVNDDNTTIESDEYIIKKLSDKFGVALECYKLVGYSNIFKNVKPTPFYTKVEDKKDYVYEFNQIGIIEIYDTSFFVNLSNNLDDCTEIYKYYAFKLRDRILSDANVYKFFKVLSGLLRTTWAEKLFNEYDYDIYMARSLYLPNDYFDEKVWVTDFDISLFDNVHKTDRHYEKITNFRYSSYKWLRPYERDKSLLSRIKYRIANVDYDSLDEIMEKAKLMCCDGLLNLEEMNELSPFINSVYGYGYIETSEGRYISKPLMKKIVNYTNEYQG